MPARMTGQQDYQRALDNAQRLLGQPLVLPLSDGEPPVGEDFRRLATIHTFGDSWPRSGLDDRTRGQLRIALNSGVTKEEIVELFIHLQAYTGAARAFDSYQIVLAVFAESDEG
jgi:4-carboxymuconolactone decarboxylase